MTVILSSQQTNAICIGTNDLGVDVDWTYAFVGPGTQLAPIPARIALDVGGCAVPGVIDQHGQSVDNRCTAELAVERPDLSVAHLLGPLWQEAARGSKVAGRRVQLRIVTHRSPDFDAIVAIEIVRRWVEQGAVPDWLIRLARFATLVDQGRFHGDASSLRGDTNRFVALHECYLVTQHLAWRKGTTDRELVALGGALLSRFATCSEDVRWAKVTSAGVDVHVPIIPVLNDDRLTSTCANEMGEAVAAFDADLQGALVQDVTVPVKLPDAVVGTASVRGVALSRQPESVLFKYLARRAGFILIVWPYQSLGRKPAAEVNHPSGVLERPDWFPRVVVSTNAEGTVEAQRDSAGGTPQRGVPCLIGLGRRLEALEARYESGLTTRRSGAPRYPDNYCNNDDPWYDGRDKDHTIVDCPRVGTLLPYSAVIRQVGFLGLPDGVSLVASRRGVDEGLDSPTEQNRPPYWEPTLASAVSVRVVSSTSTRAVDPSANLSPTTLQNALIGLWDKLRRPSMTGELQRGQLELAMPYGASESLVIQLEAISASKPVGLSHWAQAVRPQTPLSQATQVGFVHEISVGAEIAGRRVLRALEGDAAAATIVVHDTATIRDNTFVLRAERASPAPPSWLLPLVRTAVAVEGLKAWQRWFRQALAAPKDRPMSDLVLALAGFWLWESLWSQLEKPGDARAGKVVSTLKDSAVFTALLADTRRLAARLDTVVQRLEAEQGERASAFMNNTLFLLTGVGVAQFLQSLNGTPIIWSRDWWWAVGTPVGFVVMLGLATGMFRRIANRFVDPKSRSNRAKILSSEGNNDVADQS